MSITSILVMMLIECCSLYFQGETDFLDFFEELQYITRIDPNAFAFSHTRFSWETTAASGVVVWGHII
jgi:hypothetical protein